jgi:hypothetical protein
MTPEQCKQFAAQVSAMRTLQKQYFLLAAACRRDAQYNDKRKAVLEKSKAAEAKVDALILNIIKEDREPTLFGIEMHPDAQSRGCAS